MEGTPSIFHICPPPQSFLCRLTSGWLTTALALDSAAGQLGGCDLKEDVSLRAVLVGSEMHPSGSFGKCLYVKDFGTRKP